MSIFSLAAYCITAISHISVFNAFHVCTFFLHSEYSNTTITANTGTLPQKYANRKLFVISMPLKFIDKTISGDVGKSIPTELR